MNKKFSTLVASLLLTSAFTVYSADAKPMLATPTQVETRAISADVEEVQTVTAVPTNLTTTVTTLADKILPGFTNNARIFYAGNSSTASVSINAESQYVRYASGVVAVDSYVTGTDAPVFYWSLVNGKLINNKNQDFQIKGYDHFEIIPVKTATATDPTYYFAIGTRDHNGNLLYVKKAVSGAPAFELTNVGQTINDAGLFCSVETAYTTAMTGNDLNDELGGGFNFSVYSKIEEDATVNGAEVFAGKLTAVKTTTTDPETTGITYRIMNEDGLCVVFEKGTVAPSDPVAEQGQFKLVKFADIDVTKHVTNFTINAADNGSDDVYVTIGGQRLYIAHVVDTYSLTYVKSSLPSGVSIENINYALTSLSANNYVNMKQFLQGKFVTIDFVAANMQDPNNAYKAGGRLAVLGQTFAANKADYVAANGLYEKAPEAQWAVTAYMNASSQIDGITLTNRENPAVSFTINKLRKVADQLDVYETVAVIANTGIGANEQIKISFVEDHSRNDGYAVFNANELRNKTWYLGQSRKTADGDVNVYWAENHGTHQIGATVEEAMASKWNLSLVNKKTVADQYRNQTDSVLVVTNLDTWNPVKSRIETAKDTLVILPYAFQNRANNEFVQFNKATNLNYYECDDENKKAGYVYGTDAIFALKLKANGDYNYVSIAPRLSGSTTYYNNDGGVVAASAANTSYKSYASEKVFQENSTDRGTWAHMSMYAKDANSLMFVTEVTAPEYRKLVSEQGVDTVKIYRAENESQVVYEKRDDKSVVDGRTLSFLNIDNVEQFGAINPALYVDTAYVNRGENTRYQYLLGVNVTEHNGFYCEDHGFAAERPCSHAVPVTYKEGRYLINMMDTANVYGANVNIHNNPYINETEEGVDCAKLSFVDAIHVLADADSTKADKLYVINNAASKDKYTVVDLATPAFNVAKFAFKYVDSMNSDEFKIQTLHMPYNPSQYVSNPGAYAQTISEEGYLRWVNGCLVVDKTYQKGDVFNMDENETRTPTANEEISAENSAVVVVAENGAVVVKGAEGKNVIVSTILGKVVANETLTSDNATIAAPAGIVVVSVEGESFKVVVK